MSELTTGGINFGYESPVNIIMGQVEQEIKQIQNETENTIMSEIRQQLGVYVDKEELIKALQYDRNQYDKGYSDGRASMVEEFESLKAELQTPNLLGDKVIIRGDCYISLSYMSYILDKHSKELNNE